MNLIELIWLADALSHEQFVIAQVASRRLESHVHLFVQHACIPSYVRLYRFAMLDDERHV